ncbi:MAG: hypothetical protein ABR525_05240 [Candidatus Limnocylindria bacterium]
MTALQAVMIEVAQALATDGALALLSTGLLAVTAALIVQDARSRFRTMSPRAVPIERERTE